MPNTEEITFKEIYNNLNYDKPLVKHGLSLGITFSKEEIKLLGLEYGNIIRMDGAKVIKIIRNINNE